MARKLIATLVFLSMMVGVSWADQWELGLSAGSKSLSAGIHHKTYMHNGYFRIGGSGVYTDDSPTEYKWGSLDFTVGSDTLFPGLSVDVGLRGILGSAEKHRLSGDLGAVAFTGGATYFFSPHAMPVPLEVFSSMTWAPSPLSFIDAEQYFEFNVGGGLRIISNASILLSYTAYRVEMKSGPGDWELKDDVFRVGVVLRF